MIIQIVTFESSLSEEQVMAKVHERLDRFRALPGLIQKYYVKLAEPNRYGGVYLWDSMESLQRYRASDLAKTIAGSYAVVGQPTVQVLESMFPLRA